MKHLVRGAAAALLLLVSTAAGEAVAVDRDPRFLTYLPTVIVSTTPEASFDWSASVHPDSTQGWTPPDHWDVYVRKASWSSAYGPETRVARVAGTSTSYQTTIGNGGAQVCVRVRPVDTAGTAGEPVDAGCHVRFLDDRALTTSPGWVRVTAAKFWNGSAIRSTHSGALAKLDGTVSNMLAVMLTTCPGCGEIGVYRNGVLLDRVSLESDRERTRQIVTLRAPVAPGRANLTVKVIGSTSGVRIDGVVPYKFA